MKVTKLQIHFLDIRIHIFQIQKTHNLCPGKRANNVIKITPITVTQTKWPRDFSSCVVYCGEIDQVVAEQI